MKTYKNLIGPALSDENLYKSLHDAVDDKSNRPEVAKILKNIEKSKEKLINKIKNGGLKPRIHRAVKINDGYRNKIRITTQPYFEEDYPEQWIHHIVINTLKPIFMHGMYEFSCGSIPDRGIHYGKRYLERFIKENKNDIKYVLKLDIFHFYESVNVEILKERFKKYIKDDKMLELVFFILDSNKAALDDGTPIEGGLPIGFYTSQWFANWLLQPLDHFIKEELKAAFYVRYMDDMVILGRNKKELHKAFFRIQDYLKSLGLKVKHNHQVFRFDYIDRTGKRAGRMIDFMGFKFYRDKTTIRKAIFLRACRTARKMNKKGKVIHIQACRIMSYRGWFLPTNTFTAYQKHITANVSIGACRKVISFKSKKENKQNGNSLQRTGEQRKAPRN